MMRGPHSARTSRMNRTIRSSGGISRDDGVVTASRVATAEGNLMDTRLRPSAPASRLITTLLLLVATAASVRAAEAQCDTCAPVCAPCAEKVCVTHARAGKQSKHCWDVECAEVCIPAVRFPWECRKQTGCDDCCVQGLLPKCGTVRTVRKLKKVKYDCDVCEYEHTIECRGSHCGAIGCDVRTQLPAASPR